MKLWLVCILVLLVASAVDGRRKKKRDGEIPPPPPPPLAPPMPPPIGGPIESVRREPKKNYVAWSGIDNNYKPDGTIFEKVTLPEITDKFLDKFIRPSGPVAKGKGGSSGSTPKPSMPTIIKDDKRLFLNSIALKQLKMKPQQVVDKVQSYLANPRSIGDELVFGSIMKLLPTPEEEKSVVNERVPLDPSKYSDMDQVVILLSAIPLVREKMNAIRTMAAFAADYPSLAAGVDKMIKGIKDVDRSTKLANLIATTAAVGAKVSGKDITFPLEKLLEITSGKSPAFPTITYLHYIAALLKKGSPGATDLSEDLTSVEREWAMRKKYLEEETGNLRKQFQEVKSIKPETSPFYTALSNFVSSSQTDLNQLGTKIASITEDYDKLLKKLGMMTTAERKALEEQKKKDNQPVPPPQKDLGTALLEISEALKKASAEISDPNKKPGFLDLDNGTLVFNGGSGGSGPNSAPRGAPRGSPRDSPRVSSPRDPRGGSSPRGFF